MVLDRKEGDLMTTLKSVIAEYEVGRIVIGLPLNMDGSPAVLFDEIIGFVEQLKADTGLPVDTWDERLTSAQAERILLSADTSRKKRKRVIDKMAAAIILESYMAANPEIINSLRKANENSL
jgi:putative Holliday junction resolvase